MVLCIESRLAQKNSTHKLTLQVITGRVNQDRKIERRKWMKTSNLILIAVLQFHSFAMAQADTSFLQKMESKCDQLIKSSGIPSLAFLYAKEGRIEALFARGVRAVGQKISVASNDQWHLGSDSKAMTAFLVALAIQEGKFSWDTNPSVYLNLSNARAEFKNTTVEMLSTHRSGLADLNSLKIDDTWLKPDGDMSAIRMKVSTAAFTSAPSFVPDSKYLYGNINYIVLGAMLEKAYGQTWEKIMASKLFEPLNMTTCGFGPPGILEEKVPSQPWPHDYNGNGFTPLSPSWDAENPRFIGPAGTVHCSLSDWMKFLQNETAGYKGKGKILSPALFQKLFQAGKDGTYTYGAWLRVDRSWAKGPIFTHDGSNTFNYASAVMAPEIDSIYLAATNSAVNPSMFKANPSATAVTELIKEMILNSTD